MLKITVMGFSLSLFLSHVTLSQAITWNQTNFVSNGHVTSLATNRVGHVFVGIVHDPYWPVDGLYRSTNEGMTWNQVNNGLADVQTLSIALNSRGWLLAGSRMGGISRSTNNGGNWIPINNGAPLFFVPSIVVDSDNNILVGTDNGIYKSTNDGNTWVLSGLTNEEPYSLVLNSHGMLFVGSYGEGVVYTSQDSGASWTQVTMGWLHPEDSRICCYSVYSLFINSDDYLLVGITYYVIISNHEIRTINEFYRSTDNGGSWQAIFHAGLTDRKILSLVENSTRQLFAAAYGGGVYRSLDHGLTWDSLNNNLPSLDAQRLAVDSNDYLYVGLDTIGVYKTLNPTTSIQEPIPNHPTSFTLLQNYPNPFNSGTIISFTLPTRSWMKLSIFDVLGREVAILREGQELPGDHQIEYNPAGLPSGVYLVHLATETFRQSKNILYLK